MSDAFTGDRIILNDLGFFGYHGVFPEEERLGQRFYVDMELGIDLADAAGSDDLDASVNYGNIYKVVEAAFTEPRMKLIEAVGHNIVTALFEAFPPIRWIKIRVRKPEAPIAMVRGYAAVELHRVRGQP
jgi:dihydroneopterin aldolase